VTIERAGAHCAGPRRHHTVRCDGKVAAESDVLDSFDDEAAASVLVSTCGAPMGGAAQNGHVWSCAKNHQFRVTAAGATVYAIATRGDRACGVDLDREYIWHPSPGSPEVKASPRRARARSIRRSRRLDRPIPAPGRIVARCERNIVRSGRSRARVPRAHEASAAAPCCVARLPRLGRATRSVPYVRGGATRGTAVRPRATAYRVRRPLSPRGSAAGHAVSRFDRNPVRTRGVELRSKFMTTTEMLVRSPLLLLTSSPSKSQF